MGKPSQDNDVTLIFVRIALVVVFVPGLLWVAGSKLGREMARVPKFVWWECCDFVDAAGHMWRTGKLPEDEW